MPMFAPQLKNLRVKLQERKDAVMRAKYDYVESHLKTFLKFISEQPVLSSITAELENVLPGEEKKGISAQLDNDQIPNLPEDETKRASYLLIISKYFIDPAYEGNFIQKLSATFRGSKNQDDIDEYTEQLLLPLYHYYDERIDDSDLILYLLYKYKRVTEWFRREPLFNRIQQNAGKQEAILDADLREFLVVEGIDFPFSTPHSPQGRADIVIPDEDKPIPMEIKLFDNDQYRKDYIRKGLNQALKYAEDYSQSVAYLVIFNLSDKTLQVEGNNANGLFPTIDAHNKTVFVVIINIAPITLTASEQKKPEAIVLDVEYLLSKANDD